VKEVNPKGFLYPAPFSMEDGDFFTLPDSRRLCIDLFEGNLPRLLMVKDSSIYMLSHRLC